MSLRLPFFIVMLIPATLAVVLLGLAVGSESVPFSEVLLSIQQGLGARPHREPDPVAYRIVWQLRFPRVLLAAIVGGGLSIVGVAMQTLVRNPLAEPYILGLSSGASAGASLFYLGFLPPLVSRAFSLPSAAFAGALLAMVVVFLVARTGGVVPTGRLLLAGVAVSAFLGAITAFVTFASPEPHRLRAVLFWLLGSLSGSRWSDLLLPALASLTGLLALLGMSRSLDAFLSGEEAASSLGVSVERLKVALVVVSALVTGLMVAAAGVIGFVGLIVPHAVRFVVGVTHRRLVPATFACGALFLILADVAARTLLADSELPIGVLTALCGVPFFLVLLRRSPSYFA
jgi:iron complex transport system permease protein